MECLNERFREAAAETAANRIEGAIWRVWKTQDDLSLVQAINFLGDVSENLGKAVRDSLARLTDAAGVPAPVNLASADGVATLLTGRVGDSLAARPRCQALLDSAFPADSSADRTALT